MVLDIDKYGFTDCMQWIIYDKWALLYRPSCYQEYQTC